jgi:hypothetical protein
VRVITLVVAVLIAVFAPAAIAGADSGTVAIVDATGDMATATFSVTKTTCATTYYCGWFPYATIQPASQACATTTPVWVGALRSDLTPVTETATFYSFASEGPHRLCLYVYAGSVDALVAELVYSQNVPPPAPTPPPTPPSVVPPTPAPVDTTPIPRSLGHPDPSSETLAIFPAEAPYDVDTDRFVGLVRGVARRWDIYTGGVSTRPFVFDVPDRRNGIGFAAIDEDSLGTTSTWFFKLYRKRKVCGHRHGRRVCHTHRRYVGREIVERDTALSADVPWQQGPDLPGPEQFDLESVIIHELGHWAGNRHVPACTASPMVPALDMGEWWRSPTSYHFTTCGLASVSAHRPAGRFMQRERSIDVTLPGRVPNRSARSYAATLWAHRTLSAMRPPGRPGSRPPWQPG